MVTPLTTLARSEYFPIPNTRSQKRILSLANTIEKAFHAKCGIRNGKIGFNLAVYLEEIQYEDIVKDRVGNCRTVACIAGWACLKYDKSAPISEEYGFSWSLKARGILGLTEPQADELFTPEYEVANFESVTPLQAVKALRNVATKGRPNWLSIIPPSNRISSKIKSNRNSDLNEQAKWEFGI